MCPLKASLLFPFYLIPWLQVPSESEFLEQLRCGDEVGVKVLSIFGNTGDGKSHTLNHILFGGEKVFKTSKSPNSCTVGVWAAFEPQLGLIALDTEGLLGAASNQNQRMRLLLKVAWCGFLLVALMLRSKIFFNHETIREFSSAVNLENLIFSSFHMFESNLLHCVLASPPGVGCVWHRDLPHSGWAPPQWHVHVPKQRVGGLLEALQPRAAGPFQSLRSGCSTVLSWSGSHHLSGDHAHTVTWAR